MNTKPPECWACDPQAQALRIEMSPDHSLVLPYEQFIFSELKRADKNQRLRLVFVTHEVTVSGQALRRIEMSLQRRELSNLQILSRNHYPLVTDGQPIISDIAVAEICNLESNQPKS